MGARGADVLKGAPITCRITHSPHRLTCRGDIEPTNTSSDIMSNSHRCTMQGRESNPDIFRGTLAPPEEDGGF